MATLQQNINWLLREKYGGKLTSAAKRDIERLENGEHVDYVIGFSNFLACKIDLKARPLIPRPETEFWTERIAAAIREDGSRRGAERTVRVLDIFCGSGCIGIATLKRCSGVKVDFADIESRYFPGIRRSAKWNHIPGSRLHCIRSDVFENIDSVKYDYILANPPYIRTAGRKVQKSVLEQEPHAALFGGADGLRHVRALLRGAKEHLAPGGTLVVEFDPPQKNQIDALGRRFGYEVQCFKDHYGRWRYASLKVRLRARSRSLA